MAFNRLLFKRLLHHRCLAGLQYASEVLLSFLANKLCENRMIFLTFVETQ